MAEPFIFIAISTIKEGKLEDFKRFYRELSEFVEANEPRMIHFGAYFSEDGAEVTNIQVHPDADSMEFHMQVAGAKISEGYEFFDATESIEVCGTPNDVVLEMMRQIAGSGVPVSIKSDYIGFNRLQKA